METTTTRKNTKQEKQENCEIIDIFFHFPLKKS